MLIQSKADGFSLGWSAANKSTNAATYSRGSCSTPNPSERRCPQYGGLVTTTSTDSSGSCGISSEQSPQTVLFRGKGPISPSLLGWPLILISSSIQKPWDGLAAE